MRYLVTARMKPGREKALLEAVSEGTLGRGSVAGTEYVHDMHEARLGHGGRVFWVETCFCDTPLAEERPYWEEYFDLLSVQDAHNRRNCRHENGTAPWACCECDCTRQLEKHLKSKGNAFLETLKPRRGRRS